MAKDFKKRLGLSLLIAVLIILLLYFGWAFYWLEFAGSPGKGESIPASPPPITSPTSDKHRPVAADNDSYGLAARSRAYMI